MSNMTDYEAGQLVAVVTQLNNEIIYETDDGGVES
jgi:hypothetical protein